MQLSIEKIIAARIGNDNYLNYTISPFQKSIAKEYSHIYESSSCSQVQDYIANFYNDKFFSLTGSGREALEIVLQQLGLTDADEVWIETTTNNFYVSSCVTHTIEKFCRWSRSFSKKTKAILLIHEFGFPIEEIKHYLDYQLPIIEDCAFSFLSQNSEGDVGFHSDFLIASFPKFLPVPWGG
ncbi:DegT/DnrJ/EryC1/StrS aminotransferase family protein, partial [Chromobacterium violaceum]|uniref:DegT/DnrJ/EryC1/StrS aminotransferase family protein n=3 Tax=Chromobacterium violaceum TaxID=536 RepID=UPI001B3345EE